ncbi:MAG: hypothetical protein L6416_11175 [Candidatus Omnitrophica bacterium]|nr:hypothetical protein [Candidatus Omnitrophota bacterium]
MDVKVENNTTKNSTFTWAEDISVQKLLDVVVEILAAEYIETAKNNPEIFEK